MSTPVESAQLILQLFELRRESVMRQARAWFGREFNPTTFEEFSRLSTGKNNAWFRMVVSYWDMAASLVTFGAIDPEMFCASNGEIIVVFAKVEPFLAELRQQRKAPEFLQHAEKVVHMFPGAAERLPQIREQFLAMASRNAGTGVASGQ